MANIMSMVKLRNRTQRNGFDLSKKNAFTAKVGELLPVYCKEVLPGDKFDIKPKWFTRTRPVNTAAYTRIREYYDFFFVPTNLLWKNFNVFVTNMLQQTYSASAPDTTNVLHDKQPYFTVNQICTHLLANAEQTNYFGYNRSKLTAKLLHYLGYGDFSRAIDPMDENFSLPRVNAELNPFPLLAYQKACDDFFRNSQWQTARPNIYNLDYLNGTDLQIPVDELSADNPSVYNMFDMQYCNWNKDYFMGLLPSSQYGDAATIDVDSLNSDSSDMPLFGDYPYDSSESLADALINLTLTNSNYSPASNVVVGTNQLGLVPYTVDSDGKVTKANYYLDSKMGTAGIGNLSRQLNKLFNRDLLNSAQSQFTVLALRQAEAKQKWAEITQSNTQDYRSQVKAHFGKNVSEALSMRSTYIGGIDSTIDISEVVNTNLPDAGSQARIQGKGVGVGQGSIEFDCPVHGYIIGIYHAVPLLDYSMTGIKRQNLKTTFMDYAIPEFDQTGMVKVPVVELTNSQLSGVTIPDGATLGYAPRYVDYKTDIDEVHGAFFNGGYQDWVAPLDDAYIVSFFEQFYQNDFRGLVWPFMKVNPAVLNPIFDGDVNDEIYSDQLLVNCYFDVKAVRNLDVNGLPY